MTDLPTKTDLTSGTATEGEFQAAIGDLYDFLAQLLGGSAREAVTISAGTITPNFPNLTVDTESAAAADNLSIIAPTNIGAKLVMLRCTSNARAITLLHEDGGTGQLSLTGAANILLDDTKKIIVLSYNSSSTKWEEVWRNWGAFAPSAADKTAALTALGLGSAASLTAAQVCQVSNNLSELTCTAATARTNLGLGSLAIQAASAIAVTGGSITGITDLTVADGGTGRSSLTDHGVVIGAATAGVNVTSAGTAGQVLTSNGASADPTFQDTSGAMVKIATVALGGLTGETVMWTAGAYTKIVLVLDQVGNTSSTGVYLRLYRGGVLNSTASRYMGTYGVSTYWLLTTGTNCRYSGTLELLGLQATQGHPGLMGSLQYYDTIRNFDGHYFNTNGADIDGVYIGRLTSGTFIADGKLHVYGVV